MNALSIFAGNLVGKYWPPERRPAHDLLRPDLLKVVQDSPDVPGLQQRQHFRVCDRGISGMRIVAFAPLIRYVESRSSIAS